MQVVINREGAVTVLKPLGPLVSGELAEMEEALVNLSKNWTRRMVVNLSEATYMDSAGLELISRYQRQLTAHGLKLKLCQLNELTRKIFDLTRLSQRFEIFPDTSTAVRSFL